ncbi:MAG: exopolysaccharide biosynthesis protein [Phycisphaerae bacterium]|nr:exopolysaccharide biosynthesis protein [Phycisphaerae bacterium]MCZ2398719.1 exopolysaccharide biosynthesis protein [Phycisphaerae bacterium]NUQ49649.1 exopolysaccharide biosynthesis protein [Phycisphaerae bacterium]
MRSNRLTQVPSPDPAKRASPETRSLRLSAVLAEIVAAMEQAPAGSAVTVGDLVDRSAQAGFGFVIALLALLSMPFPGVSLPFGLAIAFGAVQMVCGRRQAWLPARVRRHTVSPRTLRWIERRVVRWTRGLERLVRPRFEFLTRGPGWMLCGGGVLLLAIGLALPLPIPLSNLVFIIPLLVYAVGLLENDGLLIMFGHATVLVLLAAGLWFGHEAIGLMRWAAGG